MGQYSSDNPYKDKDLSNNYNKQNADRWEYNKKTYGAGGISILNDADGSKKKANDKLAKDMEADQKRPMFGGGIPTAANRTGAAMGMGTSPASVGRQNYKPSKGSPAKPPASAAPAPKAPPSKPAAKKKAAPAKAKAKAKPREDTQRNMTRVGMKDSNGPKKLVADKPKSAPAGVRPDKSKYRGAMVLRGPEKSPSGLRKDR